MEYIFSCSICGHRESWTTTEAAQAAGVWHVWHIHHDTWVSLAGDRLPAGPLPESLGRQFEAWELQS